MSSLRSNPTLALTFCAVGIAALTIGGALQTRGATGGVSLQMAPAPITLSTGQVLDVQKFEVSIAQWNQCFDAAGCTLQLGVPEGMTAADTPATGLSYLDVDQFVQWINAVSNADYRLPTLAEWTELAADVLPVLADPKPADIPLSWTVEAPAADDPTKELRPRGGFQTTDAGVADLDGSVWEWTQDCYDGSEPSICAAFYLGGEHTSVMPFIERDPSASACIIGSSPTYLGFRLVRDRVTG